ncbi:uncharacterized protein PG998_005554 [Apiospora kogelbergensis]|uniref:uncharacterized protein n=1 Tax=Apiospora kogelbergensis TaxID=1337665 RepID=UPI0031300672
MAHTHELLSVAQRQGRRYGRAPHTAETRTPSAVRCRDRPRVPGEWVLVPWILGLSPRTNRVANIYQNAVDFIGGVGLLGARNVSYKRVVTAVKRINVTLAVP